MRFKPTYVLLLLIGFAACSEKRDDDVRGVLSTAVIEVASEVAETRTALYDEPVSVGFDADADGAAAVDTRAVLGDDWRTVSWSNDDKVVLWASTSSSGSDIAGEKFEYFAQSAVNAAQFTGSMKVVADDEYECVAAYPVPASIEGRRVTYNIPEKQDGTYRSEWDVMVSDQSSGKLTGISNGTGVRLTMHHVCHALQIRIPEGRNHQGKPVTRLLVEFPREVAGDISFDMPDASGMGDIALANGKKAIELDLSAAPLDASTEDAPQYLWVFITPGTIEGDISFTPLFDDGYCAETLSASVDREFAGGRVTPVNLTISEREQSVTWLDFTVDYTQLGEAVNTLTVTAPENGRFRGDVQSVTVSAEDGKFSVGYYAKFYPDAFNGANVDLVYDSTHAVVEGTATLPASPVADDRNTVAVMAPYLFFEDFSGITQSFENNSEYKGSDASNPNPITLDEYGLQGWTGARVGGSAGIGIRIMDRTEIGAWVVAHYNGRIDSAPISNIKAGMNVDVHVAYDYAGDRYNGAGDKTGNPVVSFGYTTTQGTINISTNISNVVINEEAINIDGNDNNTTHYGNTPHSKEGLLVSNCSSEVRLSWKVSDNHGRAFAANGVYWLYLDNIRVSIAQ